LNFIIFFSCSTWNHQTAVWQQCLQSRSHGGGNFCPVLCGYVANPEV